MLCGLSFKGLYYFKIIGHGEKNWVKFTTTYILPPLEENISLPLELTVFFYFENHQANNSFSLNMVSFKIFKERKGQK